MGIERDRETERAKERDDREIERERDREREKCLTILILLRLHYKVDYQTNKLNRLLLFPKDMLFFCHLNNPSLHCFTISRLPFPGTILTPFSYALTLLHAKVFFYFHKIPVSFLYTVLYVITSPFLTFKSCSKTRISLLVKNCLFPLDAYVVPCPT